MGGGRGWSAPGSLLCDTVRCMAHVIRTYDNDAFIEKITGEEVTRNIGKDWAIEDFDIEPVGYNEIVIVDVTVKIKMRMTANEAREALNASELGGL